VQKSVQANGDNDDSDGSDDKHGGLLLASGRPTAVDGQAPNAAPTVVPELPN